MVVATHELPIVKIPYSTLVEAANDVSLHDEIRLAFDSAPDSLGLLLVTDLPPSFEQTRQRVLLLANEFCQLPEETRDQYADPISYWTLGWNFGRQTFNGRREINKGAYCANPNTDFPAVTPEAVRDNPACYRSNIWPSEEDCPNLEPAMKDAMQFVFETGRLLARACDSFVSTERTGKFETKKTVQQLIEESQGNKGCLLHYFAPEGHSVDVSKPAKEYPEPINDQPDDRWCAIHTDHGAITALVPAMFLFHPDPVPGEAALAPLIIPAPNDTAGLYIKSRDGKTVKAVMPDNCLAFQTGETLSQITSYRLAATDHFVHAGAPTLSREVRAVIDAKKLSDPTWANVTSGSVTRETLAVFLQPDVDEVVGAETGETFGEFTKRVQQRHYGRDKAFVVPELEVKKY